MIITEDIKAIISSLAGEFNVIKDHRNSSSSRTGVIEISAAKQRMFVKIHNRLSRWNPEVCAYKNWVYILEKYAPTLLHAFRDDTTFGIIISPLEGRTINEHHSIDESVLKIAYYKAGELLRQLHDGFKGTYYGIPLADGEPLEKVVQSSPVNYINTGLESALKAGYDKGLLHKRDRIFVEWCMRNSDVFENSQPVPTNWDFSPQNWMIDEHGSFTGLIDFENMLWGIDVDSFGVIIERYTQDRPLLRKTLFEGYGLENTLERQLQLKIISAKMAIADITYGSSMNDLRVFTLGRKLLDSLK